MQRLEIEWCMENSVLTLGSLSICKIQREATISFWRHAVSLTQLVRQRNPGVQTLCSLFKKVNIFMKNLDFNF